ncbi:hypothetical protein J2Y48_004765 [Mycoplana sp. BE70]|nr:hypothetical protein [Mycoplana sp. BE70]
MIILLFCMGGDRKPLLWLRDVKGADGMSYPIDFEQQH